MKKKLIYIAIFIATLNSYAQITFEKGYFIDNNNKKTECYIKNLDWKYNPTSFKYKIDLDSKTQTNTIKFVSEFSIKNKSKYIRKTIKIDRSTNNIRKMLSNRAPIFNTETLFLKVLIEGQASLFSFSDNKLRRFFYSTSQKKISQLIYKKYKKNKSIVINQGYKQQLWKDLKCAKKTIKHVERLNYNTNNLSNYFIDYNECNNSKAQNFNAKKNTKSPFSLAFKIGVNKSSLKIYNTVYDYRSTTFENAFNLNFGIEGEYILPFNRNKWALAIEPTYQVFNAEKETENEFYSLVYRSKISLKTLQIPFSIKHYFYLKKRF